jgi:putative ABC transport system permease protein
MLQDIRYAIRQLWQHKGFSLVVILTFALGIGANTAVFSVVDTVLLRPVPMPEAKRLVMVWETDRASGTSHEPGSVPDFQDLRSRSRTLSTLAAFIPGQANLAVPGTDPRHIAALSVTADLLPLFGVHPLVGRLFTASDDQPGGPKVALIGESLWRSAYNADPAVVGRTIRLDDAERTVVGVLPANADFGIRQLLGAADYQRGFADVPTRVRVEAWLPAQLDPAALPRNTHPILMVGQLAAGATIASAQREVAGIMSDLEHTYSENDARGAHLQSVEQVIFGPVRPALLVLLAAAALVLLVACANVANLLLVRASGRDREVAVRTALGAGRRRLLRQFLIESGVLTLAGAGIGVLLAESAFGALLALAPADLPRLDTVHLDARVLLVSLGAIAVITLVFGLLPGVQLRRFDLQHALQGASGRGSSSGRSARRLRSGFVVLELALATMLLIGAGLLIRSFWRLRNVDSGFVTAGVLKAEYQLPASRYPRDIGRWPDWVEIQEFNTALVARLRSLPGVGHVAVAASGPTEAGFTSSIRVVGREAEAADWPEPSIRIVGADYVGTVQLPVEAGRAFRSGDVGSAPPVAIINEAANQRFFRGHAALGQLISLWGANRRVVGIVGNERFRGLASNTPPAVYLPAAQVPSASGSYTVLLRVDGDPLAVAPALRRTVHALDPELPLFGVEPLSTAVDQSLSQRTFSMLLLELFAAIALLLAMLGVHGVLSYSVSQRTREIGIRSALGAERSAIRNQVLREGGVLVAVGIAIGLGAALVVSHLLASLLYGVGARDLVTFVSAPVVLALVALVASWLPAWRATRIDPLIAMRAE